MCTCPLSRHEKIGDVQGRGLTPVQTRILLRNLKGIKVWNGWRLGLRWHCAGCTAQETYPSCHLPACSLHLLPFPVRSRSQVVAKHNKFKKVRPCLRKGG